MFFFSKLAKCLSFKFHWHVDVVFKVFFDCLPFYCFSTDSLRKHASFHTHGICAVGNVA